MPEGSAEGKGLVLDSCLGASVVSPTNTLVKGSKTQLKALSRKVSLAKHSFALARKQGCSVLMLTWHVNPVTAKMLKQWSPDQQQRPPGQTASETTGTDRVLQSVLEGSL